MMTRLRMFKLLVVLVAGISNLALCNVARGQWFISPYTLTDAPAYFRELDPVTSTHECTHGVNSMLRNRYGGQCFYVGQRRFARFARTGVRISTVAKAAKYRGMAYRVYLVDAQHDWNATGLYIFDEWVAYGNGSAVAVYAGRGGGRQWATVQQACELGYYAYLVVQRVPASYKQKAELVSFWRWHAQRCVTIADAAEKQRRNYRSSVRPWREWLRAKLSQRK